MRRPLIRRVGVAAIAIAMTIVGVGAASADDTTGSISGTYVDAHGNPIANVFVDVLTPDENERGNARTDDAGGYTVDGLAPGDYIVQFDNGPLIQWAHGQTDGFNATVFTVTAGATTVVDETQLPTGTLAGTLTNADGSPGTGVFVNAFSQNTGANGNAITDDSGHWSMTVFASDAYEVSFNLSNGLTQYAPGQAEQTNAQFFPVAADQTVTIDDQLLPTGTITGQYTDSAGNPDANAEVDVAFVDGEFGNFAFADDTGTYSTAVFAGSYNVSFFGSDNKSQYAFGRLTADTAAVITVGAGETAVVSDSQLPTGTITVTATDATTGNPIAQFCANADSEQACSNGTGVAVLSNVRQGDETVFVSPNSKRYIVANAGSVTVHVTAGQNTDATVAFQKGAVIRTTIVDAQTGAPVPNACVLPFVPGFTVWPDGDGYCSNKNGVVKIEPLVANSYSLFVHARGTTYGDQWVGKTGGTGIEQNARVIDVPAGKSVTIPAIKLDRAGTITGQVTDRDGNALQAVVGPNPITPGLGASGEDVVTDASGHYTLTNLGPYQWPLFTSANGFADQWTGGVGNRYQAGTVSVTAGGTVTNNIVMSTGAPLHGEALRGDGTPIPDGGLIEAFNAKTGDVMGDVFTGPDGAFSIPMEPGQSVRVAYIFFDEQTQTEYDGFFGGMNEATARVLHIPAAGKRIQIALVPGDNR
jgi:hypothetical protein